MPSTSEKETVQAPAVRPSPVLVGGALLIVLGVFYGLARRALQPVVNPDTYFHLRFGQEFLSGDWSLRDPGSVTTFATADWLPTQWLPQVVMAWLADHFGLAGVDWFAALMYLTLGLTLYLVSRREASPTIAALVTLLAVAACLPGLSPRPQVWSYVLTAVMTAAWLATARDGRVRWWLIPLTWLWAMVHGMWPIGPLLGGAATLGLALDRKHGRRTVLQAAAATLGSALAAGVTPVGPGLYGAVIGVGGRSEFFSEWQSPTLIVSVFTPALVLLLLLLVLRLRRPMSWTETLLALSAVIWIVYAMRTVPAGAVILAPLVAGALQTLLPARDEVSRGERWAVWTGYVVALGVVTALLAASPQRAVPEEPSWFTTTMAAQPEGTKVLNDMRFGGPLMWSYPDLDLMMHGYGDTFTVSELEDYQSLIGLQEGWQQRLDDSGARLAVLEADNPMVWALTDGEGWTELGSDEDIAVLQAPDGWSAR